MRSEEELQRELIELSRDVARLRAQVRDKAAEYEGMVRLQANQGFMDGYVEGINFNNLAEELDTLRSGLRDVEGRRKVTGSGISSRIDALTEKLALINRTMRRGITELGDVCANAVRDSGGMTIDALDRLINQIQEWRPHFSDLEGKGIELAAKLNVLLSDPVTVKHTSDKSRATAGNALSTWDIESIGALSQLKVADETIGVLQSTKQHKVSQRVEQGLVPSDIRDSFSGGRGRYTQKGQTHDSTGVEQEKVRRNIVEEKMKMIRQKGGKI